LNSHSCITDLWSTAEIKRKEKCSQFLIEIIVFHHKIREIRERKFSAKRKECKSEKVHSNYWPMHEVDGSPVCPGGQTHE
jgi:hypothetical protein